MYHIQIQLIPENDQIWVTKRDKDDNLYQYDHQSDAQDQADMLEEDDQENKKYRVIEV